MRFQGQPLPCRLQHGGLADNIFRKSGVDNKELSGVTAAYKSNDRADGTDVERELNGTYLVRNGVYWRTYGDYCVSYGDSSYDSP